LTLPHADTTVASTSSVVLKEYCAQCLTRIFSSVHKSHMFSLGKL